MDAKERSCWIISMYFFLKLNACFSAAGRADSQGTVLGHDPIQAVLWISNDIPNQITVIWAGDTQLRAICLPEMIAYKKPPLCTRSHLESKMVYIQTNSSWQQMEISLLG